MSCAHQEPKVMKGLTVTKRSFYEVKDGNHLLQNTFWATLAMWIKPKKSSENQDIMNLSVGGDVKEHWKTRAGMTLLPNGNLIGIARAEDHEERSWNVIENSLKENEWQHVALTINYQDKKMDLYVNGILVPTKSQIIFTQGKTSDTRSHRVTLGAEDDGDHAFFQGELTGAFIQPRILSAEEIQKVMKETRP